MTLTAQQIFDTVATHLLKQGKRATNLHGTCVYRGEGGTKCAVGCLIADEEYNPKMEGCSVSVLWREGWLPERLKEHFHLLVDLQGTHDLDMDPERRADVKASLLRSLRNQASEHNLNTDCLPDDCA